VDATKITTKCEIIQKHGARVFNDILEVHGFLDVAFIIAGQFLKDIRSLKYEKNDG
jgi:hypothetical protein